MQKREKSLTRRDFIQGTVGATLGASLLGSKILKAGGQTTGPSVVTVVRNQNAMDASHNVNGEILQTMLDQTVIKCTGEKKAKTAWRSLVSPEDTVGLVPTPHLNPTHQEVVGAVKSSLIAAGIPAENIDKI